MAVFTTGLRSPLPSSVAGGLNSLRGDQQVRRAETSPFRCLSFRLSSAPSFGQFSSRELDRWRECEGLLRRRGQQKGRGGVRVAMAVSIAPEKEAKLESGVETEYDAIIIGAGMGGLVAATQLAIRNAKVLLLEKYVIPGGSSGFYKRDGYTFDVGSSVMFGFSDKVSSSCSRVLYV